MCANRVNVFNRYVYLKISRGHYSTLSSMTWIIEVQQNSAKYSLSVNFIFEGL